MTDAPTPDRWELWQLPEVRRRVGYGRATIYRWIGEGRFPRPRAVGKNRTAWFAGDIIDWIGALPEKSDIGRDTAPSGEGDKAA